MSGGFTGGGFEYNLTTESEFQQMKQRNTHLLRENQSLKHSLEELIRVNNQLTDSMEEFNNSTVINKHSKGEFQNKIQQLNQEIEHYRSLALTQQDRAEIVNALEGLIESFKQTQKYYEEEITILCNQLEHYKNEWQEKIANLQQNYIQKMKMAESMATQFRKKEEIVNIIERKMLDEKTNPGPKRINKKYSTDLQTVSEKRDTRRNSSSKFESLQRELEELREKQKIFQADLKEKDKAIALYCELLRKMRSKLMQKY